MSGISKPDTRPLFIIETIIVSAVVAVFLFLNQTVFAKSITVGFLCFLLPAIFFTLRVWRYTGAKYTKQVARSFYIAEAGKYSLTVVCFVISFKLAQPLDVLMLFFSYTMFLMCHQVALFKLR